MNTIKLSDFKRENDTETFATAMNYMKEHPKTTLIVEPGIYNITTEQARAAQTAVMNGDFGDNPEKTMFNPDYKYSRGISFECQKGSTIIAYGVTLIIDGFMEPISITDCEDIEIQGLTIDHKRKPYSKGIVTTISEPDENGTCKYVVKLNKSCPITERTPLNLRCAFFNSSEYQVIRAKPKAEFVSEYEILLSMQKNDLIHVGTEYYTIHTYHSRPAILLERCKNISLTNVTIHSQPGMGIVGNRSENVLLSGLSVIPSAGDRWSTNTDATHFTSMKGTLRYENCRFEGQGDDSSNVHTYYHAITEKESENVCTIQEKTPSGTHAQTLDYPDEGDTLELTDINTLQTIDKFKVLNVYPNHNKMNCKVVLDHPLPSNTENLVFADITRLPRLELINCYAEKHFARGFLVKCREALIEGNTFKNIPLAGIEAAAESYWYEGVAPSNIVIRRNRIVNCGLGILVKSDCKNPKGQSIFNITVEDNLIDCPDAEYGIYAKNIDGLTIKRNKIAVKGTDIECVDCVNVKKEV